MNLYLNSGHDIETAAQMYEAMISSGGIPSLSVTLCDSVNTPSMPVYKLDGVSTLYNIEFKEKGLRVWRVFGIGGGQPRSESCSLERLPCVNVVETRPSEFSAIRK